MCQQIKAALRAIAGRRDEWAVKLREELQQEEAAQAPSCTSSPAEAAALGYEECAHCNGYGSSLKEEADRCTRCGGTGWARRRP